MTDLGNAVKNLLAKKEEENKYYVENYEIDLENKNDSHSILTSLALGSKKVLDVGCGVGYIGRKLKEISNIAVDGIEPDKESYKIVKDIYDNSYNFYIGDNSNQDYIDFCKSSKKYDCIILADLIEHLEKPDELLSILYNKLAKDGKVLVSIPNVAHVDVISNLIDKRFNYNKTGILDSTHLRFWTENSFYEFIDNINEKYGINYNCRLVGKTYAKDNDKNDNFIFDVCGLDIYVFQNIFELKINKEKVAPKKIKKINYYKTINDAYLDLKKTILEKSEDIETLNKKVEDINKRMSEQNKKMEQIKEKCTEQQYELSKVYNSMSWKVTKPLRSIRELFKR